MTERARFETFTDRAGKRWFNRSVVALMKERALAEETPPETIRRLAREKVAEARQDEWEGPPFDPEALADLQGIEVQEAEDDLHADARILPLPDRRLLIEYAADAPEVRRRFSICHELVHTFFPDCFEQARHRRTQSSDPIHAELERLCHIGAGELLMPLEEFTATTAMRRPSIHTAEELSRLFDSSQEASLRRMVDLAACRCCIVWLSERLRPTQERESGLELDLGLAPTHPKLRIDYQFPSTQWERFLPIHKSVPDDSILYAVLRGETYRCVAEDWTSLGCGEVELEAVGSLHATQRGVMTLVSYQP